MGRGTRPTVHKNGRVCPFCYTLRAGRAYGPQVAGPGQFGAFSFRPYCRATATEPGPQGQTLGQTSRPDPGPIVPNLGSFFLSLLWVPSDQRARSQGQRSPVKVTGPKQDGPKLGVLIFGPTFGDHSAKVSFLGRPVCGGIPGSSDLSARQPVNLPKVRAKKKGPI